MRPPKPRCDSLDVHPHPPCHWSRRALASPAAFAEFGMTPLSKLAAIIRMKLYLEFMNAARGAGRSQRLFDGGGGAELHPCGREARHIAVPLSYTIRRLETRLGVRILTRTTRRVAPTEAGERLLKTLGPALNDIAAELSSLSELRKKPAGTIRITTSEHAANTVLWPVLQKLLPELIKGYFAVT